MTREPPLPPFDGAFRIPRQRSPGLHPRTGRGVLTEPSWIDESRSLLPISKAAGPPDQNHIGLYLRPPVIAEHKCELAAYETTKSAVHFPLDRKLPVPLIRKLVMARMKKNEAERIVSKKAEAGASKSSGPIE